MQSTKHLLKLKRNNERHITNEENKMELNRQNIDNSQSQSSILYKYLDKEGAKKMLSCCNLQFTNATKLNDPFDCHPSLIDFSKIPPEKCKSWPKEVIELVESDRYKRYRENAWICCLSKVFDSLLMWSYYNSHKGVCIGLNMEKVAKYLNTSHGMMVANSGYEVQYRDIIKKPDYFRNMTDIFHYQMFTKGIDWKHEKEVRLFILKPSPRYMTLPYQPEDPNEIIDRKEMRVYPKIGKECFESIYLGVNIDKNDRENIIEIAKKINPDIKIYQMKINPNAFQLDANPI